MSIRKNQRWLGCWLSISGTERVPVFRPCNTSMLCCWNVDREKGEGEELSHPVLLPQTPAFPWIFQLSTEEQHYLQDILLEGIKVTVVELSWTDPFPSISSLFWIMRASEQADTGFKGFVQAGQAGVYKREKISSVPLLFIASSQAVSLLPVTKLPAATDVFSFGQWHVQQPTCLDKLGGYRFSWGR